MRTKSHESTTHERDLVWSLTKKEDLKTLILALNKHLRSPKIYQYKALFPYLGLNLEHITY